MTRFRLMGAALLALAACNIADEPGDTETAFNDPSVQSCLAEVIELCYDQELTPDACAALIEAQCLNDVPEPPGPGCVEQVFGDCIASGIDEMTCWAIAHQQCNEPPLPPGCDPATGMCPPGCNDPAGCEPPPPPCDPMTGMCPPPPPCDPMTGMCPPPPGCDEPEPPQPPEPPGPPPGCDTPSGMCP